VTINYPCPLELYLASPPARAMPDASFNIAWIYLNGRRAWRRERRPNGAAWLRVAADRAAHPPGPARLLTRLGAVSPVKAGPAAGKPEACRPRSRSAGIVVPPEGDSPGAWPAERPPARPTQSFDPKLVASPSSPSESGLFSRPRPIIRRARPGGLMQLMPRDGRAFSASRTSSTPGENIRGGTQVTLRWLLNYFRWAISRLRPSPRTNAGRGGG